MNIRQVSLICDEFQAGIKQAIWRDHDQGARTASLWPRHVRQGNGGFRRIERGEWSKASWRSPYGIRQQGHDLPAHAA
ncbi:hypothetical protein [Asaia bogorensis]|uniref:hypothetical protein n=1 Tax=Asaia bogorensis TaxID=91915 RepID=UPI0007862B4E|nr:hypothetical protein [Asaia bogorensis]